MALAVPVLSSSSIMVTDTLDFGIRICERRRQSQGCVKVLENLVQVKLTQWERVFSGWV